MWELYQYCDVSADVEEELLTRVQTLKDAVSFVEDQCNTAYEYLEDRCVPSELHLRDIDPRTRRQHKHAFFKLPPENTGEKIVYIAISDMGSCLYYVRRKKRMNRAQQYL